MIATDTLDAYGACRLCLVEIAGRTMLHRQLDPFADQPFEQMRDIGDNV